MRGITIILNNESIHTGDDLDLVQEKKEIGKPTTQSFTVQVPGRNGLLNLTKGLTGKVTYYNRPLSFQYFGTGDRERLLYLDAFMSRYHGETIRIIDDDYPGYYYEGEVSVETTFAPSGNYITINLEVDAQPFRLKLEPTIFSRSVSDTTIVRLYNESIPAIPEVTISSQMTINNGSKEYTLEAGTYSIEDFELKRGVNDFTVIGTGVITFKYQEGAI